MSLRSRWVVVVLLLSAPVCTSTEPSPKPDDERQAPLKLPADLRLTLSRSGCFGRCPVYQVAVDARGHVAWQGQLYVDHEGERSHRLESLDVLTKLWHRLDAVDYSALPSSGQSFDKTMCPFQATDHPSVEVTLVANGNTHQVDDYLGCHGYPPIQAFRKLEEEIDAVLGTDEWIGAQ